MGCTPLLIGYSASLYFTAQFIVSKILKVKLDFDTKSNNTGPEDLNKGFSAPNVFAIERAVGSVHIAWLVIQFEF